MRRPLGFAAAASFVFLNAFVWFVLAPPPAAACSCALTSIADWDMPQQQVFVATAGEFGPGGQPVAVRLWLHGTGAAAVVVLARDSFGQGGGDCTIPPLAPGTRWILGTWLEAPGAQPRISLCNPHAQLDTPEGQAMLREAQTAFGAGVAPAGVPPDETTPSAVEPLAPALLIGTAVAGAAVLGGLLVLVRRRP